MIRHKIKERTSLNVNKSTEGETIEQKIERIVENKEPIEDSAPIIYQERKEGINPAYDFRTDRWDIALEAMDKVTKSRIAKRDNLTLNKEDESAGAEPIHGTE